jgi:hypothetical protein
MTVEDLENCLSGFDRGWEVRVVPEDIEITAVIGKGVIFLDGGNLLVERAEHDNDNK